MSWDYKSGHLYWSEMNPDAIFVMNPDSPATEFVQLASENHNLSDPRAILVLPHERLVCQTLFSSPEPSGSQGELIVYPCSVVRPSSVRRPPFSKIFSSETAWPIKAKFYMKHLWEGGTNVYINNPGHMTKMAAMPIYGKNPSKIFFSGTTGPISTKLGMKH